jgi:hypothetical protein
LGKEGIALISCFTVRPPTLPKSSPARFELQTAAPHTVLDARAYIVSLLKRRELRGQWQRACELLLTEADVGELTKALELALFFDSKLDLTVMA